MLVKTIYTKEKGERITNVYKCDKYYLSEAKDRKYMEVIDGTTSILIELPFVTTNKETFVIYIMNDTGKTIDSYMFGNVDKIKKEKPIRILETRED